VEQVKNKESTILNEILDYTHKIKENLAQPTRNKTLNLINITEKRINQSS
tara:strand:+ start:49 stop:198 length:150 start_codon:yes stop_codon:yes gene_type:complete